MMEKLSEGPNICIWSLVHAMQATRGAAHQPAWCKSMLLLRVFSHSADVPLCSPSVQLLTTSVHTSSVVVQVPTY